MKIIYDEAMIKRTLIRISHEILERNKGCQDVVLIGIKTRGMYLAKRIKNNIDNIENKSINCGYLDITKYRDDIKNKDNIIDTSEIKCEIENKIVVLIDDVLFSGRTIRAAMDALLNYGRAKEIQLAVLIDRGHRQLPIRADYVGKNIPTSLNENVLVQLFENDGIDQVAIVNL